MPNLPSVKLLFVLTALIGLIAAPVLYATGQMHTLTPSALLAVGLGVAVIVLIVSALRALPGRLSVICIVTILGASVLIRLTYLGLMQFSGAGFNAEFFLHLSGESVVAAWHMYGLWLIVGAVVTLVYLLVSILLALRIPRPTPLLALVFVVAAALVAFQNSVQLPEAQLAKAKQELTTPVEIPGFAELQQRWQDSELVETHITPKSQLQTKLPDKPNNLIVVYLESVGLPVINPPDWPELMPHLSKLVEQHSLVKSVYASSFITIEGIVNTQCGTLFPFDRGSDSLANSHNLGNNMPCLGDVLEDAGYQNHYFGGADLAFAGKGKFLQAHGFSEPKGSSYWRASGLKPQPDTWGISDADLFEQATNTIKELRKDDTPYNLTLLTIGTHIPGFLYKQCQPYPNADDRFLDALHCTDQLLAQWLETLKELGALDDTTVVITADHHVFPNPKMKDLFGDAVYDRRVPFVVLQPEGNQHFSDRVGAGYDLAPTVLDLLNIEHNAKFALGRSLLSPKLRLDYFLNRYTETFDEKIYEMSARACDTKTTHTDGGIPTACQRNDLFNLLRRQVESQSHTVATLNCDTTRPLQISFPINSSAPLTVRLQNKDISHYFTREGRPIRNSAGLYLLWFDANGRLESTEYTTTQRAAKELGTLPQSDITSSWIAIWVAPNDATEVQLPIWLTIEPTSNSVLLGHISDDNNEVHWMHHALINNDRWTLNKDLCQASFTLK